MHFKIHENTHDLLLYIIKKGSPTLVITIPRNNSWDNIKRYIDSKLSVKFSEECSICFSKQINSRVLCLRCKGEGCMYCYIAIYRNNKGIIVCPFCRFRYGNRVQKHLIEKGVHDIIERFRICNIHYFQDNYDLDFLMADNLPVQNYTSMYHFIQNFIIIIYFIYFYFIIQQIFIELYKR